MKMDDGKQDAAHIAVDSAGTQINLELYGGKEALAERIIATVGYGRLLHVDCGDGQLVRALVERGIDAYGTSTSAAVIDRANTYCPGRFRLAAIESLPFPPGSFDAVVSIDSLVRRLPENIHRAVAELRRVCRRYAYFATTTEIELPLAGPLTKPRDWWEGLFFDFGFIRHPDYYRINNIDDLSDESTLITVPLSVDVDHNITTALPLRYVNEASSNADHFLACYSNMLEFVRAGDIVFHIGAVSSDFSHLVRRLSEAREIHVFADSAPEFPVAGDGGVFIHALSEVGSLVQKYSGRINLVLFDQTYRDGGYDWLHKDSLVPGGRLIEVVAPNEELLSAAETPHAFEDSGFRIEATRKVGNLTYVVYLARFVAAGQIYYPSIHGYSAPPDSLVNFERDYLNPWLPQNLVVPGLRTANIEILTSEASSITKTSVSTPTADYGAALCVLGYRVLEGEMPAQKVLEFVEKINEFILGVKQKEPNPHCLRWAVSLQYLKGQMLLKVGSLDSAREAFSAVVQYDVLKFSPTLMTKIISSYIAMGDLSLGEGKSEEAIKAYEKGARSGFDALRSSPEEWVGRWDHPIKGAMYEAIQIADMTNVCLLKLRALQSCLKLSRPSLRVVQEGNDSVFLISKKRYEIIENQGKRIADLELALESQARMLEQRWEMMQRMEKLLAERPPLHPKGIKDAWIDLWRSLKSLVIR